MYAALALLPAELRDPADSDRPWNRDRGAAAPAIHFRHRRKELEASAFRPWLVVVFLASGFIALTCWACSHPGPPSMTAWSGTRCRRGCCKGERRSRFRAPWCFRTSNVGNCHSLGGAGGDRGPPLDNVAVQLTKDQLIRQVLQGSGEMPAYGDHLHPAEVAALVSYLRRCIRLTSRSPGVGFVLALGP